MHGKQNQSHICPYNALKVYAHQLIYGVFDAETANLHAHGKQAVGYKNRGLI